MNENYISREIASAISAEKIAGFFETPLGQMVLRGGERVLREFKFSLLVDGSDSLGDSQDDRILLQGVVDCAFIEDVGITIVDFKSDRVTEKTLPDAVLRYSMQVKTYANELKRIYKLPVKTAQMYIFELNKFATVI